LTTNLTNLANGEVSHVQLSLFVRFVRFVVDLLTAYRRSKASEKAWVPAFAGKSGF
jgi:hypothetical protein